MCKKEPELRVRPITDPEMPAVAALEEHAFHDTLFSLLGRDFIVKYYAWQIPRSRVSILLGAWTGGKLVGFSYGGVFPHSLREFYREYFWQAAGCLATRPWKICSPIILKRVVSTVAGVGRRARNQFFHEPRSELIVPDSSSFCIGRVAVDPSHRRQGVAKRLFAEMELRAAALGFLKMHLFVDGRNVPAISCYHAMGWKTASTRQGSVTMSKVVDRPVIP
jgi:GNAT superfamily N-acetyltransferase